MMNTFSVSKIRIIFTGPTYKSILSFAITLDVYRSRLYSKTIYTKYCLIRWISKLSGIFKIHWVRQHLVNHGSDGHSKRKFLQDGVNFHRSRAWQIVLIFNTATMPLLPSTVLFQGMAWCCHTTSQYLSQCRPRSPSPNVITRTQWVHLTTNLTSQSVSTTLCGHGS